MGQVTDYTFVFLEAVCGIRRIGQNRIRMLHTHIVCTEVFQLNILYIHHTHVHVYDQPQRSWCRHCCDQPYSYPCLRPLPSNFSDELFLCSDYRPECLLVCGCLCALIVICTFRVFSFTCVFTYCDPGWPCKQHRPQHRRAHVQPRLERSG